MIHWVWVLLAAWAGATIAVIVMSAVMVAKQADFDKQDHQLDAERIDETALALAQKLVTTAEPQGAPRPVWRIEHDGFEGVQIGSYVTLEGKRGAVLQQIGTRVVHVYGEKWCARRQDGQRMEGNAP